MAYTKFGEFVRILRIKYHEVMGDMAKVLGTSTPFPIYGTVTTYTCRRCGTTK